MRRKVGADDFKRSGNLLAGSRQGGGGFWRVCDKYEIRGCDIVAKYPLSNGEQYTEQGWRSYRPLEEAPDLFLKFARLHKELPDFEEAALEWSRRYGLPGDRRGEFREDKMPVAFFWKESRRAWVVLSLYEAALHNDHQAIQSLLSSEYQNEALIEAMLAESSEEVNGGESFFALAMPAWTVSDIVGELCHQRLVPRFDFKGDRLVTDPADVEVTWTFHNLLGAMYLQMFWLIASGGNVTRCKYCGRIISLSRPNPEGRKRRRDKRFCDDACRQASHRSKKKT